MTKRKFLAKVFNLQLKNHDCVKRPTFYRAANRLIIIRTREVMYGLFWSKETR